MSAKYHCFDGELLFMWHIIRSPSMVKPSLSTSEQPVWDSDPLIQRFSNCGPRTTSPRVLLLWSF